MAEFMNKPITATGALFVFALVCIVFGAFARVIGGLHIPFAIDLWPTLIWFASFVFRVIRRL